MAAVRCAVWAKSNTTNDLQARVSADCLAWRRTSVPSWYWRVFCDVLSLQHWAPQWDRVKGYNSETPTGAFTQPPPYKYDPPLRLRMRLTATHHHRINTTSRSMRTLRKGRRPVKSLFGSKRRRLAKCLLRDSLILYIYPAATTHFTTAIA